MEPIKWGVPRITPVVRGVPWKCRHKGSFGRDAEVDGEGAAGHPARVQGQGVVTAKGKTFELASERHRAAHARRRVRYG